MFQNWVDSSLLERDFAIISIFLNLQPNSLNDFFSWVQLKSPEGNRSTLIGSQSLYLVYLYFDKISTPSPLTKKQKQSRFITTLFSTLKPNFDKAILNSILELKRRPCLLCETSWFYIWEMLSQVCTRTALELLDLNNLTLPKYLFTSSTLVLTALILLRYSVKLFQQLSFSCVNHFHF